MWYELNLREIWRVIIFPDKNFFQTCKSDIKKLKQREIRLAIDLNAAHQEINKLRQLLKMPPLSE